MKRSRWLSAAGATFLLLAALPAWADTLPTPAASARAVYLNGNVYRVVRNGGSAASLVQGTPVHLTMQIGKPQDVNNPYTATARTFALDSTVTPNPATSAWQICQYTNHSYGG